MQYPSSFNICYNILLFKDGERWADICVTEVIDACHFWAHVGGKPLTEKIETINRRLLSQVNI